MTDTLTQLVAKLQSLLLDDGTRFTTATCTAAIRQALKEFNLAAPIHAADLVTAELGIKEYELPDITAMQIIDILRQGQDTYAENHTPLAFDAYFEDGRPFFRLHVAEAAGNILIARYTTPHTVYGLDSATDSTLSAIFDAILLDGAAWQACIIRAAGRIETINLNSDVPDPWQDIAEKFHFAFTVGLLTASRQKPPHLPDFRSWNDEWVGQY